uniref:activating molecule in BECN1-regulated autophagy protein 1 isoform X1 n=2 Tax=Myxine glutinosa TaxID=7769 RepID=UPI00358F59E5
MSVPICMDGWRRGKRTLVRHRGKKNAVYILCGRERGNGSLGTHRKLQDIAEDKACQMQWDSRKVDLPDSPRSTFLLAFSPDRSLMASTHVNHNIYITEVYTNHCTHSLVGHRRTPWCVTFHPSIKGLLASGCLDGEVRIWDLHGGSESWYTQNNVAIASLAFHPTVQLLVIATANEIHFWDWSRPEPFAFVKTANEMERVRLVRFDPLGHNLLTAVVNPSNQQPEEDTEASNDASLRQRSMLHAQLIRRAPMLHNYLHMPPFRPPGSGVDEGTALSTQSNTPETDSRRISAYALDTLANMENGGRSFYDHVTEGRIAGGGGSISGGGRTSPDSTTFHSLRDTSHSSVFAVLRDRFGYLTSTQPSSSGSTFGQRQDQAAALSEHGRTGLGWPTTVPGNNSERMFLPPSPPPVPYASLVTTGPSRHPNLGQTEDIGSRSEEPRQGSWRPFSVVSQRTQPRRTETLFRHTGTGRSLISMAGWSRSILSMEGLDFVRSSRRPVSEPDEPDISFLQDVRSEDEGLPLMEGVASDPHGWSSDESVYPADSLGPVEYPLEGDDASDVQGTIDMYLSATGAESPAVTFADFPGVPYQPGQPELLEESLNNNNNISASVFDLNVAQTSTGRLESQRTASSFPSLTRELPDQQEGSGANRVGEENEASSSVPVHRCRACHNLLTFTGESRRWEEHPQPGQQRQNEGILTSSANGLESRRLPHASSAFESVMPGSAPSFHPPRGSVGRYSLTTGAQSTLEGQSRYSGRSGILYRPRSQSERLASTGLSRELRPRERARLRLLARASGLVENVAGEAADDLHQEDILPRDVGERTRPRIAPRSRLPSAALGRFTPRRFLLPDYFPYPGIFHERGQPGLPTHSSVRVFTGAVVGDGQSAVANNIADITYRLQWWNFTNYDLPEISNSKINVLVCKCKIYNDASCDISSDGRYLAAFVPGSHRDIADEGVLAIYSLAPHNLGEVLYQRRFGPNAISVSLSPVGRYILVGLASRRIILQPATEHMVAQVFRLQQPHAGDSSMRRVFDVVYPMPADQRRHVSINSARWLPDPGLGLAYGTNRGDLVICRPVGLEPGGGSDVSWDNLYTLSEAVDSLQAQAREMEHNNGSSPRVAPLRTEREIALMNAIGLQPRGSGTGWLLTSRATQTQRPVHSAGTQTDAEPSPGTIQEDDSDEHLSASSSESSSSGSSPESHLPQRATGDSPGSPHDDSTDTINNVIDSYHALYHQHETADQAMTASPASAHASPPGTLQSDLSDNHGELSDQTEPTAPVAVVAADSTVEENGAEASGSNSEEANDVAVSLATEDAAVVCHRLTSGGMSAVVTRGRVTTVASMGGFGNEIVVSHVVSSSAQTAPEGRGHVPGPAANTPPTDLSLGAEGSGLPCLDITLPQNVFSTDAHSRTHNENLIPIEVSSENIPDLADNRPGEEEFRSSSVISNLALQLQQDREAAESMTDSDDEFEGPSREEFISSLAEIRRNVPVSMETERELEENDNSPEDHLDLFCGDYSHW